MLSELVEAKVCGGVTISPECYNCRAHLPADPHGNSDSFGLWKLERRHWQLRDRAGDFG